VTVSSLKTDILGVWINTKATIDSGRIEGREQHEWQTVLGSYFGLTILLMVLAKLSGAESLLDNFFGEAEAPSDWLSTFYLVAGIVVLLAIFSVAQWLVLPAVSGWFGGSRNRADATLAYYYFFCAGVAFCLISILADFLSVGLKQIAPPLGSYLALAWIVIMILAGMHISVRIIETAQFAESYLRALAISLVSFFLITIAIMLILGAAAGVYTLYVPE
jgi:hypothetical protein